MRKCNLRYVAMAREVTLQSIIASNWPPTWNRWSSSRGLSAIGELLVLLLTSNMTGCHRGSKRKLGVDLLITERCHYNAPYNKACHISYRRVWYRALSLRMRVFEVRASSSSPSLPLCQISFLSRPPLLSSVNHSITQSLTHPAYVMRREPKLSLRKRWLILIGNDTPLCVIQISE